VSDYEAPERIRNLGIIAHIDAGKTTVTERILFHSGVERRLGEVAAGTTAMDWMEEERERGITITAAATHVPWREHLIQIVDTPGHVDFTVEVERCLRVLDGAILVLDGVAGVQAQTESVARRARRHGVPMLAFVNKMDRAGGRFAAALASLRQTIHPGAVAAQLPHRSGADFDGVLDLVQPRLLRWDPESGGQKWSEEPVPEPDLLRVLAARDELCALAAEDDEKLAARWVEKGSLTPKELRAGLRAATLKGRLLPVFCGSALKGIGIQPLLDGAVDFLPAPDDLPAVQGKTPAGKAASRAPRIKTPACLLAFKVFRTGKTDLVYFRQYSGVVRSGDELVNARTGHSHKLEPLFWMHAEQHTERAAFGPGGIFAVPALPEVRTGDTLCAAGHEILLEPPHFPQPVLRRSVEAREPAHLPALTAALQVLVREDPTLSLEADPETGAFILAGMGELHLEVAEHRLEREFKLAVRMGLPQASLAETVLLPVTGDGSAGMQGWDGARWQVRVRIEPQAEEGLQCHLNPKLEAPAGLDLVEMMRQATEGGFHGPQGYPLRHCQIWVEAVRPGSAVAEPNLDLAAGALAAAVDQALRGRSVVLEPIMALQIEVPEAHLAQVLADLQQRHADIQDVRAEGGLRLIVARAALSRLLAYSTAVRSLSQGKALFDLRPAGLAPRQLPLA
jgi:elongation factor G